SLALPPIGVALPAVIVVLVLALLAVLHHLQRRVAFERLAFHRALDYALDVADFEAGLLQVEEADQVLAAVAVHVDALAVATDQARFVTFRTESDRGAINLERVEGARGEQRDRDLAVGIRPDLRHARG